MKALKFTAQNEEFTQKAINKFVKTFINDMKIIKAEYIDCQKEHNVAGDILLENYYIIQKVYLDCLMVLTHTKSLPYSNCNMPRIYDYAYDFCRLYNNIIEKEELESYLIDIGRNTELQNEEINLFIDMFRVALIKILAANIRESENKECLRDVLTSLRFLSHYTFDDIYDKISKNERLLKKLPDYASMDKSSKNLYRYQISKVAKKKKKNERDVILEAKEKADNAEGERQSHFGYYLFKKERHCYIQLTMIVPFIFAFLIYWWSRSILCTVLSFLPLWEISKSLIDFLYAKFKRAAFIPRLDIKQNCPKTLVTITTFIGDEKAVDNTIKKLKEYYYSNRNKGIKFGFLADLPPSNEEHNQKDLELCKYAEKKIQELNKKYDDSFFGCVRRKHYTKDSGKYQGRERKRGAVADFLKTVETGNTEEFLICCGNVENAKYFVALDDDTKPDIDSIKKLVGVLEHPLSKPVYNKEGTAVIQGYGIAAPRMNTSLRASSQNLFSQIIGGIGGVEMYGNPAFTIYQDLFGEGIFAGKGVINIECFNKVITGIFPDNKILSHDILESSFLNCAFVSDVVFYDSVPKNILSFTERNHRWVRGDWQNIGYIGNKIRTQNGKKIDNPISGVSKYKLFDNLRRSLMYPAIFIAMIYGGLFNPCAFLAAVIAIFINTILEGINALFTFDFVKSLKYRTKNLSVFTRTLLYSFFVFSFLPYSAIKGINAVCKAIWRQITKKNLMEWTTADQADKKLKGKFGEYLKKMWPQLLGLIFILNPIFLPVTVIWLFGVPFAYLISKPYKVKKYEIDVHRTTNELVDMWHYFNDFLNDKNNYLPPDNYQEEPLGVDFRRTSPTNIGLAMLCCLGAHDLGFINEEKMCSILEKMLDSIDKLDKWNGHLLNWYNNETLKPLHPRYVSTVDNGNFISFIFTLRNGLRELNSEISDEIIKRLDNILETTDFSILYNDKKKLFHIGYDFEKEAYSDSYYDLYASEALLTSFYCVAKRQIPLEHWQKLGRYPIYKNGYMCVKSWTGTMFEYFMPKILLPNYEGSFSDEMLHAVIGEQKARNKNSIWGNSESAFYSFDLALVYQYKAFGVQSLALKRGMNEENVISPYSSWLAMPFFPKEAEENLKRLKDLGAYGKYGYYDAVDKTLSRTGGTPAIIRNYMVHHVAMSFLSGVNALKENIMQKRFMDMEMSAYSGLLEEKLPTHIVGYHDNSLPECKTEYYHSHYEEHSVLNPEYPLVRIISNGSLSSFATDSGIGYLKRKGYHITKHRESIEEPKGIYTFFKHNSGIISSTYAPLYDKNTNYKTYFEEGKSEYIAKQKDVETRLAVTVNTKYDCEVRELILKNNTMKNKEGDILFYFEPVLAMLQTEMAHPAFSGLFINGVYDEENRTLFINRRKREEDDQSLWLGICCAESESGRNVNFEYELSRYKVLDHLEGIKGISSSFNKQFSKKNTPVDPCVAIRIPVSLNSRETISCRFYIAVGRSKQEAQSILIKTKKLSFPNQCNAAREMALSLYQNSSLKKEDVKIYEILAAAIFTKSKIAYAFPRTSNKLGMEKLWSYGVSGDFPIIMLRVTEKSIEKVLTFLKAFLILKIRNADCELAICFAEGGRYDRPIYSTLRDYIRQLRLEKYLNARNGLFLCNIKNMDELSLLGSLSRFYADLDRGWKVHSRHKNYTKPNVRTGQPTDLNYLYKTGMGGFIKSDRTGELGFGVSDKYIFPERPPWCHILANRNFGTMLSESSLGFTFGKNASMNKITPWSNDIITDNIGEKLLIKIGNHTYDIFYGATAEFYKGYALYKTTIGDIKIKITVFVPLTLSAKIISVEIDNPSKIEVAVKYEPHIILGSREISGSINKETENEVIYFNNPLNQFNPKGYAFFYGTGCKAIGYAVRTPVKTSKKERVTFALGYGNTKNQAFQTVGILKQRGRLEKEFKKLEDFFISKNNIQIETPDKALNVFYNTFLTYQAIYSRLTAKTGFYQCSGAIGFRDQLQDALCLSVIDDRYLKQQLIVASKHQFEEGDVLHWWHKGIKGSSVVKGARTKSSDDLFWLPYALCEYVDKTDDITLAEKVTTYVTAPVLTEEEQEKYLEANISKESDTIYVHAKKAIFKGVRTGEHGLILFGSGDWNDGMNNIGTKGIGETVWGTFFAIIVLEKMSILAERMNDKDFVEYCNSNARDLRKAIDNHCWDGDWFLRGFFDNGIAFGSKNSDECQIDLISQAFSSIAGGFDPYRVRKALDMAGEKLVDRKHKVIKLLDPAFENSKNNPGYIQGYVKGTRENGGQYTHAAIWYAWSLFKDYQYDKAYEMLNMINPAGKTRTKDEVFRYRVEPFVLAADVYSNPDIVGMGGWSHYTGAAGWYFKIITEELLGIRRKENRLYLSPQLPKDWQEYKASIKYEGANIEIVVRKSVEKRLLVDGVEKSEIILDGKNHKIEYLYHSI